MHTPDMSDEELDALFQRSAESYPDEHNLSAWLDMERRLDAAAVQQQVRGQVLRIFALETVVVLLALLGWLSFSHQPKAVETIKAIRVGAAVPRLAAAAARPAPAAPAPAPTNLAPRLAAPAQPQLSQPLTTVPKTSATPPPRKSAAQPNAVAGRARRFTAPALAAVVTTQTRRKAQWAAAESQPSRSGVSSDAATFALAPVVPHRQHSAAGTKPAWAFLTREPASQPGPARKKMDSSAQTARPAGEIPTDAAAALGSNTGAETDAKIRTAETGLMAGQTPDSEPTTALAPAKPLTTAADSVARPAVPALAASALVPDSAAKPPRPALAGSFARLSIAVLYAPELSTVRWAGYTIPGSNLGLLLEYRLAPRWRLSVGALRSVKRYEARGSDYHPPAAYWTNGYTIDEVDATCRITDVPLNLRYDVLQRPRAAVFASAGLSSLLMRREDYSYYYYYKDQPVVRTWTLEKGSSHLLSVLNLSAGYEHRLGRRWAAQAEPFAKIPLGGVGFGKVKLSSAGVFFALKYALLPAR